jgi:hypothetical protein
MKIASKSMKAGNTTHLGFAVMKRNEHASSFFMLKGCQTNRAQIESCATGTDDTMNLNDSIT